MLQLYGKWTLYPNRVGYKAVTCILLQNCAVAFDFYIYMCPWNEQRFSKRGQSAHCLFHTFVVLHFPSYFIWIYEYFIVLSKHFFIIPTDAHIYKVIGMLKTIKIPTIAPTCFGSRRNHHQGAISCLVKTTVMILLCLSLMTWSMLWLRTNHNCSFS